MPEAEGKPTSYPVPDRSSEKRNGALNQQEKYDMEIVLNNDNESSPVRICESEAWSLGIKADINITSRYLIYDLIIPYNQIVTHDVKMKAWR